MFETLKKYSMKIILIETIIEDVVFLLAIGYVYFK